MLSQASQRPPQSVHLCRRPTPLLPDKKLQLLTHWGVELSEDYMRGCKESVDLGGAKQDLRSRVCPFQLGQTPLPPDARLAPPTSLMAQGG